MSKVQVDTIVDKDDISAPSLTKGAIVTGVCTATSFDGAISEWVLGANGSSDYTFTGSGLTGAENDPTLYLKRGQKYRFKNSSGGHPFRIQSTANGSTGTAYNDGVTNNDAGNGTTLEWDVQFDAPDVLYYQCTAHGSMGGKIYIGNSGNSSTLVDLNVSGISTFSGDVSIADKIIHTGDVDTTIRFPSADTVSVETAGQQNVQINGTRTLLKSPSGTNTTVRLQHQGNSGYGDIILDRTVNAFIIDNDPGNAGSNGTYFSVKTIGSERLRIDSAGKVGIGTTIPTRSFDVRGDATIGIDQHSGNPGTTVGILTVRGHHVNSDSEYAQLYLANSNSSGGSTASIRANRDATSNFATSLSFFTNHTAAAGNGEERLRVGTTGQIGLSAGGVGVAATDYGTSGQVLTSGGASATATWATPSAGSWEVVSTTVLAGSTSELIYNGWDTDVQQYKVSWNGLYYASNMYVNMQYYFDSTAGNAGTLQTSGSGYFTTNDINDFGSSPSNTGQTANDSVRISSSSQKSYAAGEMTFNMKLNAADGQAHYAWGFVASGEQGGFLRNRYNYNDDKFRTGVKIYFDNDSGTVSPTRGRITWYKLKYS